MAQNYFCGVYTGPIGGTGQPGSPGVLDCRAKVFWALSEQYTVLALPAFTQCCACGLIWATYSLQSITMYDTFTDSLVVPLGSAGATGEGSTGPTGPTEGPGSKGDKGDAALAPIVIS